MNILDRLDPRDKKQLRRLVYGKGKGKVNYLAGTMAPAKSDPDTGDIESIEKAFEHYAKRGVEELVVQPKWMGSRCQVYLFEDVEDCYAVSRNGFLIDHVDLKDMMEETHNEYSHLVPKGGLVILDGELVPWSVLGQGLIDRAFKQHHRVAHTEHWLKAMGIFDEVLMDTYNNLAENKEKNPHQQKQFDKLRSHLTQEHIYDCDERDMLATFKEQLDLYGGEGPAQFKAFDILKIVDPSLGLEVIKQGINRGNGLILNTPQYEVGSSNVEEFLKSPFYKEITTQQYEGVVVKPAIYNPEKDCAPYLKVRNPDYLYLTYGYDYRKHNKLSKLIDRKRVGRKIGLSIKEYAAGMKLLKIPYSRLSKGGDDIELLFAEALFNFKAEENLDPRL